MAELASAEIATGSLAEDKVASALSAASNVVSGGAVVFWLGLLLRARTRRCNDPPGRCYDRERYEHRPHDW